MLNPDLMLKLSQEVQKDLLRQAEMERLANLASTTNHRAPQRISRKFAQPISRLAQGLRAFRTYFSSRPASPQVEPACE